MNPWPDYRRTRAHPQVDPIPAHSPNEGSLRPQSRLSSRAEAAHSRWIGSRWRTLGQDKEDVWRVTNQPGWLEIKSDLDSSSPRAKLLTRTITARRRDSRSARGFFIFHKQDPRGRLAAMLRSHELMAAISQHFPCTDSHPPERKGHGLCSSDR